jgi:anti-sigma-K factor RskA
MSALLRVRERRALAANNAGSLPPTMRMRQSLAQFEEAFREEAAESIERRERLRKEAAQRSRVRRVQRTRKLGSLRFAFLTLAIVVTAVIVTVVMFETLAMLAGG